MAGTHHFTLGGVRSNEPTPPCLQRQCEMNGAAPRGVRSDEQTKRIFSFSWRERERTSQFHNSTPRPQFFLIYGSFRIKPGAHYSP